MGGIIQESRAALSRYTRAASSESARDSPGIEDRVHIMVDISDDTKIVQRRAEITGVVRRRRWNDEEKGRIVAEAIAPDAVKCGRSAAA